MDYEKILAEKAVTGLIVLDIDPESVEDINSRYETTNEVEIYIPLETALDILSECTKLQRQLEAGKQVLMGIEPKVLTVEFALAAFGFGKDGLK